MDVSTINYVCSFGVCCHTAKILQKNNLKLCSYPFDWIFSNYENIIHCIQDEFKTFLDKSFYIHIDTKKCGHSFYNNYMWYHHNPLNNTDDYNYVVRCVDRFKNLLQYKEHKLFVMLLDYTDNTKNNLIEFNNQLSKYTTNYTFLVILNHYNKQSNYHNFTFSDNIHFLELHTKSRSNGLRFIADEDNDYLNNIIKSIYHFILA
jgi:hypothetical protein